MDDIKLHCLSDTVQNWATEQFRQGNHGQHLLDEFHAFYRYEDSCIVFETAEDRLEFILTYG